jgi:hypothetical protein
LQRSLLRSCSCLSPLSLAPIRTLRAHHAREPSSSRRLASAARPSRLQGLTRWFESIERVSDREIPAKSHLGHVERSKPSSGHFGPDLLVELPSDFYIWLLTSTRRARRGGEVSAGQLQMQAERRTRYSGAGWFGDGTMTPASLDEDRGKQMQRYKQTLTRLPYVSFIHTSAKSIIVIAACTTI